MTDQTVPPSLPKQRVVVTDFDMPFGSLVFFMLKVGIASIPAALILAIMFAVFGAMFSGCLAAMYR